MSSLIFDDPAPHEEPVRIFGKEYVLKEATGAAVCKWRNAAIAATRMSDGKVSGVGAIADTEPLLVSLCVFTRDMLPGKPPVDVRVPEEVVRGWPGRYVKALHQRILEVSGLAEPVKEEDLFHRILDDFKRLSAANRAAVLTDLHQLDGASPADVAHPDDRPTAEEAAKNWPSAATAGSAQRVPSAPTPTA